MFAVDEDDRVVPTERKRDTQKGVRNKPRRRTKLRRRGLGLGRLVYWCLVLMLWAGIGLGRFGCLVRRQVAQCRRLVRAGSPAECENRLG